MAESRDIAEAFATLPIEGRDFAVCGSVMQGEAKASEQLKEKISCVESRLLAGHCSWVLIYCLEVSQQIVGANVVIARSV